MADEGRRINSVAPLANVLALSTLIERVQNRGVGLPGMACFYGPSGYGKTTAATWCANRHNAYQVQVKSVWTTRSFCEAVVRDIGLTPGRTVAHMVDQISREMAITARPLLIDEADHLVKKSLIEIVRDIYESSGGAVILIGEEQMPVKLQQWERVHGRMLDWVAAQPADDDDARHLALIYCPGVQLSDQLILRVSEVSRGSIRRISVNFDLIYEHARTRNLKRVGMGDIDGINLFTGQAPAIRRGL